MCSQDCVPTWSRLEEWSQHAKLLKWLLEDGEGRKSPLFPFKQTHMNPNLKYKMVNVMQCLTSHRLQQQSRRSLKAMKKTFYKPSKPSVTYPAVR